MSTRPVHTPHAPAAIGPYSQAIVANGFVYTAGQVAIQPETGVMLDGDIRQQTQRVMENLKAVLEAAGSDFGRVVNSTVYLQDLNDFAAMNEIYAMYFENLTPPARSTIQVAKLPRNALVEIALVAVV